MTESEERSDRWPRDSVTGNRCWCSACGRMFGGPASFDWHRGIRQKPRTEDAQDSGRCSTKDLEYVDRVYWTPVELATRSKLQAIREARQ